MKVPNDLHIFHAYSGTIKNKNGKKSDDQNVFAIYHRLLSSTGDYDRLN